MSNGSYADPPGALLVVHPDEGARIELRETLAGRYGNHWVLSAQDPGEALEVLSRRDDVAVALVDVRLGMGGPRPLLAAIRDAHPQVRRAVIAATYVTDPGRYDESDWSASALARGDAEAVLPEPWQPAHDRLFPFLDDLLADWGHERLEHVSTLTVISAARSPRGQELRDVLTRNGLPHEWVDAASPAGAKIRDRTGTVDSDVVVLLHNGAVLRDPTNREIADALGVRTSPERDVYDLVIVGAGPAGLAAAVYGASEGLATLGIEAVAFGGQAGTSSRIENYLGFPAGISGGALMHRAGLQAGRLGARALIPQRAVGLSPSTGTTAVHLEDGQVVRGRTVVLATGVEYRRLPADGVDRLVGAGVSYGSPTVQLPGIAGGDVYLVGGGNSAGQAAVRLAQEAAHVTLVVRGRSLAATMSHYLIRQLDHLPNVTVLPRTTVVAARGSSQLAELVLEDSTGDQRVVPADALFVMIGATPRTGWLPREVARDEHGFVLTGSDLTRFGADLAGWDLARPPFLLETSLPRVFAVGDVRHGSVKRVASAVGEGSTVVSFVHEALRPEPESSAP